MRDSRLDPCRPRQRPSLDEIFRSIDLESSGARALLVDYLEALARIQEDRLQNRLLGELVRSYVQLERRVDSLLKNTLPAVVAEEIKYQGGFAARSLECSILFSDFAGFTQMAEDISAGRLVRYLDRIFTAFDDLVEASHGTKIKTIGDAYMAVFGAPEPSERHAVDAIAAALDMMDHLPGFNQASGARFQMRIGIHSGSVVAGVVGRQRMQFDVFGDAVNVASRFESAGAPGRINVSEATYRLARETYRFEERGLIRLKNKADMKAFFVLERGLESRG